MNPMSIAAKVWHLVGGWHAWDSPGSSNWAWLYSMMSREINSLAGMQLKGRLVSFPVTWMPVWKLTSEKFVISRCKGLLSVYTCLGWWGKFRDPGKVLFSSSLADNNLVVSHWVDDNRVRFDRAAFADDNWRIGYWIWLSFGPEMGKSNVAMNFNAPDVRWGKNCQISPEILKAGKVKF